VGLLTDFFTSGGLAPHGYCLLWRPGLVWTHVLSDVTIALAYFSIPIALVTLVRRRPDVEFGWMFWLFALFITACGMTHVMGIWTLWHADYGAEAAVKAVTAVASAATAVLLWRLIPRLLAIPSASSLRRKNEELAALIVERDAAVAELSDQIAERKRTEEALVSSRKMEAVGQLTGGIAHDFNNLLQAVAGNLELIVRDPADAARVARRAAAGLSAAERGARLTGQLLAFSRVQRLTLQTVELTPLIDRMRALLTRTLGAAIRLEIAIDAPVTVLADATQLEVALLNLATNAREAMPDGGTLRLTIESRDGMVALRVADTGIGMSEGVQARAFDPFFTTKPVGAGTGLGLSMVYGIMRQSGGSIAIESTERRGTTITLMFQRTTDAPDQPRAAPLPVVDPISGPATILVVDDDSAVRSVSVEALRAVGYTVAEADGGPQAIELLDAVDPDLVLLDYAMPDMTGAEVANVLRARRPRLPILFATGFADTDALAAALGPDVPMIRKPYTIGALHDAITQNLGTMPS
jgi:signal transduction histidine kinase